MVNFNRKIYQVGFVLYDLYDNGLPLYFDDVFQVMNFLNIRYIGNLVRRFNSTKDNYIYVKYKNEFKKLYYVE